MISPEILLELVPNRDPEEDYPHASRSLDIARDSPGRRIAVWAEYLRYRINREISEDQSIENLLETSGFLATGVIRVPQMDDARSFEGFPTIDGYQFGAVLFRGSRYRAAKSDFVRGISLEHGRLQAPLLQTVATFNPHASYTSDGYICAFYEDEDGENCGITAAHIVESYRLGQRVPILCSDCGDAAKLAARAPGLIDAAKIVFPCGGPGFFGGHNINSTVRGAIEGETVEMHLGDTGKVICTVMLSLSTPAQIKSAAVPKHFLTDIHGHPGDSGSLVSGTNKGQGDPDLIGMYLGDTNCQDETGAFFTYGYSLDLQQAADILGAPNLSGEFNV
ncbi:hypothetical protein [Hyphomonas sp.]|uniref:hypothetical protein n=1 Tax=Hyphomonas sp. TaxID=87 RepID=UPI0032D94F3B